MEGNKKSLVDAIEKGIDLCKQIPELYNDYYHGGLMKLVVIGGESLDVLQHWVVELFSDVRQGSQGKPEFKVEGPVWRAGKLYRLEAVKDVHILELRWALPCLLQAYLQKPEDYLAHLLGHEVSDELWDEVIELMKFRVVDKVPLIRTLAVRVLSRFVNDSENSNILDLFLEVLPLE
ncbi:nardilysin-like isoform X1 [Gossypium raimondii]|nr:nardilysin-like isoform X1 [Gossypium raimondii]XP_052485416.1 nardilysin-like isoform X1 [Gossypium raimondii]XP_052485417.1 nardilysin-like isoform X1 [Gossypium raimondii]XP_052485418.1 nardilysin-like isoform X1 [Gossypium raimondii]